MDEFKTDEASGLPEGSQAAPRWTGAASVELAHQLNQQCIALICQLATACSTQELPQFVQQNRDLWRLLEPDAGQRVAAFPFVIVDFRFKDVESWRQASEGHLMNPTDSTPYNGVLPKLFEDLLLEILLFARQAARENVGVAKTMFAMTPAVASLVALLTLPQVRSIAMRNSQHLRVRWANDPEFWRDLLVACRAGDEPAIEAVRRQAKLLFCGEFIASHQ